MTYLMPLAGEKTSDTTRDRLLSEERAFRMLSEGERLFELPKTGRGYHMCTSESIVLYNFCVSGRIPKTPARRDGERLQPPPPGRVHAGAAHPIDPCFFLGMGEHRSSTRTTARCSLQATASKIRCFSALTYFVLCPLFLFFLPVSDEPGELFYVETDVHEDRLDSARHDHGHLGGVSLETITAARFLGQQPAAKKGPGSTGTEATSRSSSQDTQDNENNAWEQQPPRNSNDGGGLAGKRYYSSNRISLKEAQEWDFSKKLDELAASESRGRERSFSEPRLSSMARPAAPKSNNDKYDNIRDKHQDWFRPQQQKQRQQQQRQQEAMGTVDEDCSTPGWKMPKAMPFHSQPSHSQPWQQQTSRRQCGCHTGLHGGGGVDACAGMTEGIQRAWTWVLAGGREEAEEEENPGIGSLRSKSTTRVNSVCRNYASCTSTKTFEVSPRDREALAKLGVTPETGFWGVGAPASMTFTMHVAGYR